MCITSLKVLKELIAVTNQNGVVIKLTTNRGTSFIGTISTYTDKYVVLDIGPEVGTFELIMFDDIDGIYFDVDFG